MSLPFCTIVEFEWNSPAARTAFESAIAGAMRSAPLPTGRLSRIVGLSDAGARIIELWASSTDARRFAESSAPGLGSVSMPAPSRVVGFEVTSYEAG